MDFCDRFKDEPTASLDPETGDFVRSFLENYQKENRASIILASHNMAEVERLCSYVLMMNNGTIIDQGSPRELIKKLDAQLVEMKKSRRNGLCCGAGGAQMFKDAEPGNKEINIERTEQALETKPDIIAAGCPFCNTMMTDGIKNKKQEHSVKILDVAELIANSNNL